MIITTVVLLRSRVRSITAAVTALRTTTTALAEAAAAVVPAAAPTMAAANKLRSCLLLRTAHDFSWALFLFEISPLLFIYDNQTLSASCIVFPKMFW